MIKNVSQRRETVRKSAGSQTTQNILIKREGRKDDPV